MKKLLKGTVGVCIAIVISIVAFVVRKAVMVQNVFDEIYYAEHENQHYKVTKTRFENVIQYKMLKRTLDIVYSEFTPYNYKDEYMNSNESAIRLSIWKKEPEVFIGHWIYGSKNNESRDKIFIGIAYSVSKKELTYERLYISTEQADASLGKDAHVGYQQIEAFMDKYSITREDIERMQQELFDRIITDWCNGNAGLTRFSLENPGKFTIVDNTWARFEG